MASRHGNYNEIIANDFKDLEYAQSFITHIVKDEKLPVEEALKETIKAMGLEAFAKRANVSNKSVSDFVFGKQKWNSDKVANHIHQVFKIKEF